MCMESLICTHCRRRWYTAAPQEWPVCMWCEHNLETTESTPIAASPASVPGTSLAIKGTGLAE